MLKTALTFVAFSEGAIVIDHKDLPSFGKAGATLTGIATPSLVPDRKSPSWNF